MKPLLMVGSSGHASTILEAIELCGEYEVIGLLDSFELKGTRKHGYVVLGRPEEARELSVAYNCRCFFVGIGDNWQRWSMASSLMNAVPDLEFATVIYPNVFVSKTAHIGCGTVLMSASSVMANAIIGVGCIVNTSGGINHDCQLADYSSVSGGAQLGGGAVVGLRSSVGIGAVLLEKKVVGRDTVIGAGAVVFRDMPDEVVSFGVPARVVKSRRPDESYLA